MGARPLQLDVCWLVQWLVCGQAKGIHLTVKSAVHPRSPTGKNKIRPFRSSQINMISNHQSLINVPIQTSASIMMTETAKDPNVIIALGIEGSANKFGVGIIKYNINTGETEILANPRKTYVNKYLFTISYCN